MAASKVPRDHVPEVDLNYCNMKNIFFHRLILAFVLLILIFSDNESIYAQLRVSRVNASEMPAGKKGLLYNLPRTMINVELAVTKTQQFPGPLAEYAAEYLGLDNVIIKGSIYFSVENAAISSSTEADPNEVYLIEKEEKSSGEIWISFDKGSDLITIEKFDKTAAPKGFTSWNEHLFEPPESANLFRKYTESPTREKIDTMIRRISVDTLVIEEKTFKRSMVKYTDQEKAQEAADKIKQIEKDKYNLMVGYQETAYSREAMEYMYNRLEEERLEYMKLFTGVSVKETLKFTYEFFPDPGKEEQEYRLAALSKIAGIIAPDGQNDVKVIFHADIPIIKPPEAVAGLVAYTGFVYRVPATAQALLIVQGKEMDSRRFEILQFGPIMSLPQEFKRVEFDMETGALKSVVIE
jgi:hypothetical protein